MNHDRWLSQLILHEQLMATLYRGMAAKFAAKRALLEQLACEEAVHASMIAEVKNEFLPGGLLTEGDIDITLSQLEARISVIRHLIASLENDAIEEQEIIDAVLELELSNAELQVNKIVVRHRDDPRLQVFAEILDAEDGHNRILEEW